jgi:hypothetical protein
MIKKEKKREEFGPIVKKIVKMYENYGIDISDMAEEEFERIKNLYTETGADLDADLKKSAKYKDIFADDIM